MHEPVKDTGQGPRPPHPAKHIAITDWLDAVALPEYMDIFKNYKGVEDLLGISELDLKTAGVKNSAHRAKLISSLAILKEKFNRRYGIKTAQTSQLKGMSPAPLDPNWVPKGGLGYNDYAQQQYQPLSPTTHGSAHTFSDKTISRNTRELSAYKWYHGAIPRIKAENSVERDGEFLVRDSVSKPGDYVLTCSWKSAALHFMVNKQQIRNPYSGVNKTHYQFEEDLFDSVPKLIQFYIKERKPVSTNSGAILSTAVARDVSVDYYDIRQGQKLEGLVRSAIKAEETNDIQNNVKPPMFKPVSESNTTKTADITTKCASASNSPKLAKKLAKEMENGDTKSSSMSRIDNSNGEESERKSHKRVGSEPLLLDSKNDKRHALIGSFRVTYSDGEISKHKAPPKPSRVPSVIKKDDKPKIMIRNKELYDDDGRDYSDYDQLKADVSDRLKSDDKRNTVDNGVGPDYDTPRSNADINSGPDYDTPRSHNSINNSQNGSDFAGHYDMPKDEVLTLPVMDPPSQFNMGLYISNLMTPNNKPLESSAWSTIQTLLLEVDPVVIAKHILWVDLRVLKVQGRHEFGLGVQSGLELITLPQGEQLRLDDIERCHTFWVFVAVTIIKCSNIAQRAKMIHQWIHVAAALKMTLGNLHGFMNVMEALKLPEVTQLRDTWLRVNQAYPDTVFLYNSKLCSIYHSLNDAASSLPLQNVTIPHILPLIELMQRSEATEDVLLAWEDNKLNLGIEVMLAHLDTARIISDKYGLYSSAADNLLRGFTPDSDMLDMFRTEMHIKFLWGARAVEASFEERMPKFKQVLKLLSDKCEPSQNGQNSESSL